MLGPNRGSQLWNRRCSALAGMAAVSAVTAKLFARRPVLRTAAKSPHPANPAHAPALSMLSPCVDIAGRPADLPRAQRAADSSLRSCDRDQIASYERDSVNRSDLKDGSSDLHLACGRPEQPMSCYSAESRYPYRIFSEFGWNQKVAGWLVLSGSADRVPVLGRRAVKCAAAHGGSVS
jgi:hypothetical protein